MGAPQMRPQPGMPGAPSQGPRPGYKYTTAVRNPGAVPQGAQMQQVCAAVISYRILVVMKCAIMQCSYSVVVVQKYHRSCVN